MTIEEPIIKNDLEVEKAIEIIKADSLASYSVNEILSARNLAVEALKQMATTKNDKVDCEHTDCNNCVNHKYCDYEPTTKNCESCRYYGSYHEVCNYCYKCSLWTEKEPTTKNNLAVDCIDRQATLDAIIKRLGIKNEAYLLEAERVIYQQILAMPPVTPQEPKIGHWIFCEGIKGKDNVEKCSCCQSHWKEAVMYRKDTQEYLRTRLLYCPNCGAKMTESEDKE